MQFSHTIKKENSLERFAFYVLLIALVSLALQIRFVNSLSLIALFLLPIISNRRKSFTRAAFRNFYFLSLLALFCLQVFSLFYTSDTHAGWKEISTKSEIVSISFFFCAFGSLSKVFVKKLMLAFSGSLMIVSVYCLIHATVVYTQHHDPSVFFYHALLSPFDHHAVLFSFFVFYCIVYWAQFINQKAVWLNLMLLFFLFMIVLLSSKLVIILTALLVLLVTLKYFFQNQFKWMLPLIIVALITAISIIAVTNNPIEKRFADVTNGSYTLFESKKFSPAIYFNGVQFRLLTWRFTFEILNEKKAWLLGIAPGNAQHELNGKYVETDMYMGNGENDTGFLNYNCHNVYLQTLLESGIVGLIFLLTSVTFFIVAAVKKKKFNTLVFFIAILIYGFAESLLSAQYSILLFTFFPLLSLSTDTAASKKVFH